MEIRYTILIELFPANYFNRRVARFRSIITVINICFNDGWNKVKLLMFSTKLAFNRVLISIYCGHDNKELGGSSTPLLTCRLNLSNLNRNTAQLFAQFKLHSRSISNNKDPYLEVKFKYSLKIAYTHPK